MGYSEFPPNPADYPPNSEASKRQDKSVEEEKGLTRITTSEPVLKKRSLFKQFKEVFIAGDLKSSSRYVVMDIFLPMTRDILYEVVAEGFRNLVFGESRKYRGVTRPQSGDYGYVAYNRYSAPPSRMAGPQRALSRQARARHNFDEIVLDSRVEAEQVIDELFEVVSRYGSVSVADLYQLVGLAASHTDHKWGWADLHGAGVSRIRDGYLLDLPDPEPLTP